MISSFFKSCHLNSQCSSSGNYIPMPKSSETQQESVLLRLGKKIIHPKRCICFGATSVVAFLVLSKVHSADSPVLAHRALHTSSRSQHGDHGDHQRESQSKQPEEQKPKEMSKPEISPKLKQTKEGALWGMVIADALAMPVHWYYNPDDIKRGHGGWLTGYVAPNAKHPSSIMSLSNIGGSGRGGDKSKQVIGGVILQDKLKYWSGNNRTTHYHQGMKAGDNTLNSLMALEMLKSFEKFDHDIVKPDKEVRAQVLADYVKFMTTPGSHGDTYAESFHRSFFKDWSSLPDPPKTADALIKFAEQRYKEKTSGYPDSQLVVVGALVPTIPWVLRNAHRSEKDCAQAAVDFIKLTHPVTSLVPYVDMYARLLHAVLNGHDLRTEATKFLGHSELGGPSKREMVLGMLEQANKYPIGSDKRLHAYQSAVSNLGLACYIEGAFSSLLYLALEFADNFEGGVLANANVGGENCHRGAALGALLGAATLAKGQTIPDKLKDGLGVAQKDVRQIASQWSKL